MIFRGNQIAMVYVISMILYCTTHLWLQVVVETSKNLSGPWWEPSLFHYIWQHRQVFINIKVWLEFANYKSVYVGIFKYAWVWLGNYRFHQLSALRLPIAGICPLRKIFLWLWTHYQDVAMHVWNFAVVSLRQTWQCLQKSSYKKTNLINVKFNCTPSSH